MPYPYSITGAANDPKLVPWLFKPIYRLGGVYVAAYVFGVSPIMYIGMYKSLDGGVTWSELDSGNHPQVAKYSGGSSFNYATIGVHDDGTDAWFAYHPAGADPPTESRVIKFDISAGTWGTPITGGPVGAPNTASDARSPESRLGLVVRSNGDLVLLPSGINNTWGTVRFAVYSGGSWGTATDLLWANGINSVSTEKNSNAFSFDLSGYEIGVDGYIHVVAHTEEGHAYITLNPDDTSSNYRRLDDDGRINNSASGPAYGTVWGNSAIGTICGTSFFAFPIGAYTAVDGSSNNNWRPGIVAVADDPAPAGQAFHMIESPFNCRFLNWAQVAICQDSVSGSWYLVWAHHTPGSKDATVYVSDWKGLYWSTPAVLFTADYATYNGVENIVCSADNGTLRVCHCSVNELWYWQGTVTPTADGCTSGASIGNINAAR